MKLQVIGDPVLHSLSPRIHGAMLKELGLEIDYTAHVVKKGGLPEYLAWAKENGITGFNATMPHKEDLIPLLDDLGEDAWRMGAVNTSSEGMFALKVRPRRVVSSPPRHTACGIMPTRKSVPMELR